jgi:hypothetical protein
MAQNNRMEKGTMRIRGRKGNMRLTTDQRLRALERETVVLHDTVKLLHKLLKDQGQLINEYIVQKLSESTDGHKTNGDNGRPEQEVYTFVCNRRFGKIEKDVRKALQLAENLKLRLRAG